MFSCVIPCSIHWDDNRRITSQEHSILPLYNVMSLTPKLKKILVKDDNFRGSALDLFAIQYFKLLITYHVFRNAVRRHDIETEFVTVWWPDWLVHSSQLFFVSVRLSICTVYAKCKLLFATLTHLQSNSCSVVVYEEASSIYESLVCFACLTNVFLT